MRLHSLPFSDDLNRAIYEALNPDELTSDKNEASKSEELTSDKNEADVVGGFDLCTGRGKNHSGQLVGSANSATDFRYRSRTSTAKPRSS